MATTNARITLDHIALASSDLAESLGKLAQIFPSAASEVEEVSSEGVRLAFIDVGGPRLEVLESTREDSAVARYLEKRPAGIHHLSFRVDGVSIDDWFEELRSRGVEVLGDGPTDGSGDTRIFFVHPRSTGGLLVEFSQKRAESAPTEKSENKS